MGPTGQACHAKGEHSMWTFRRMSLKKMQNGEVGLLYNPHERNMGVRRGCKERGPHFHLCLNYITIKPHLTIQCN
jgi:hypothetical protein